MALNAAKQQQVLAILTKNITSTPIAWRDLSDAVSKEMTIKNWLDVRGVLQYMINNKMVVRIKDVYKEEYVTVK